MENIDTSEIRNKKQGTNSLEKINPYCPPIEEFYFLKIGNMWKYFKTEHFSFWMICFYLFFEYARPQAIFPSINNIPWAQIFLIGSLWGAIVDKSVKWVRNPLNKWLVLFAVVIYLSSINAYYPEISKLRYIDFYSWFIIYFLILNIVNTKQRFYIFLMVFILCAAKIAIGTSKTFILRGFAFTNWGLMGPTGYFQNSGELAILMLTLFPVVFLLYKHFKDRLGKVEKIIMLIFWITPILTILGASSRGAQIALLAQLILMFRKTIFKFKPFIIIAFLSIAFFNVLPEEQKKRFSNIGEDATSQQRILYLEHGWDMMQENPMLGVGYFNFGKYYETHYPDDLLFGKAELPHNIIIQVGTDSGFVGLSLFLIILFVPFWRSRKLLKDKEGPSILSVACSGILYGLIGYIVAGQFVSVAYYPFLWIGIAFVSLIQNVANQEKTN